jgi:hypothetical protein
MLIDSQFFRYVRGADEEITRAPLLAVNTADPSSASSFFFSSP